MNSAGFEMVAMMDDAFERAMLATGFRHEDRSGHLLIGYYHPDHPGYGVQQVSGDLSQGRADRRRLVQLKLQGSDHITMPSIEDMIADRLGQHTIASPTDDSRLKQAETLYRLASNLDITCLLERIRDEDGDPSLLGL